MLNIHTFEMEFNLKSMIYLFTLGKIKKVLNQPQVQMICMN